MKYYIEETVHKNGDPRDLRIANLEIVRKEIEADPIPQFHGGTVHDRAHQLWVIGFYVVVAVVAVGWLAGWSVNHT